MRNKIIGLCLLLLIVTNLLAQQDIAVGTWRTHFDYKETFLVEEVNQKIYAAATSGLTFYDKEDQSLNSLTKVDGLSEVSVSALAHDEINNLLAIGYRNGNLDVIDDRGITNISVLLDSRVVDSKEVLHLSFYNDLINASTSFGLLQIDPNTGEVVDSYLNLGESGETLAIKKSVVIGDQIYLATPSGILSADLSSELNLSDFNSWERYPEGSVFGLNIISIGVLGESIWACSANRLFRLEQGEWIETDMTILSENEQMVKLKSGNESALLLTNQAAYTINNEFRINDLGINEEKPQDIIIDQDQNIWYADSLNGLTQFSEGEPNRFVLNGPSDETSELNYALGQMITLSSINTVTPFSNNTGYNSFSEGEWSITSPESLQGIDNISQVYANDNDSWVASYGNGLLDQTNNIVYNTSNSTLSQDTTGNILVQDITSSRSGIWVLENSNSPIHLRDNNGNWSSFNPTSFASNSAISIEVDLTDNIWMRTASQGLVVFDPETLNERRISETSANLPSDIINDLALGQAGDVWIATGDGLVMFPSVFGIVESSIVVTSPIFDGSFLFDDRPVNAIAIDGGDRKWVGTADGVWLFNPSANELISQFNTTNSPLPSNNVLDIEINPLTGEVFFLTDEGLVSYGSAAIDGTDNHQSVKIFPNPVRPGYDGLVGVQGVANNAIIKITTISGRIVKEINAAGAGASWDLRDYSGSQVSSGVYLFFSANEDGSDTYVGKIAIVN